jgi:hypothetical protein
MKHSPIYLHLCNNENVMIVSKGWWVRFLLSQEKFLAQKREDVNEIRQNETFDGRPIPVQSSARA